MVDEWGLLQSGLVVVDGAVELRLRGELDVASGPALRALVEQLYEPGRVVVLDLAELEFADVAGLTALLALSPITNDHHRRRGRARGATPALGGSGPPQRPTRPTSRPAAGRPTARVAGSRPPP